MGIESAISGVTLRFLDKNGNPDGRPDVHGVCTLLSSTRPDHPGDPDPIYGSGDWLTDIKVADTREKLSAMPHVGSGTDAFTSAASKRVFVQWDVQSGAGEQQNCLTIAHVVDGQVSAQTGYCVTDSILILPSDTDMKRGHPCWNDWETVKDKLEAMAANLKSKSRAH
jgi:hypothetical protein